LLVISYISIETLTVILNLFRNSDVR